MSASFSQSFSKIEQKGCPTNATADGLEGLVDGLTDSLVTKTTVSPNVDDTKFTTISPTGTTQYLDKAITPVCMNGSPYNFFVKRGSVNKLLMYYQGGGACWDTLTCDLPACDTTANNSDNPGNIPSGFFDLSNPDNPFKDWNIVFVSYCSCDVHFGDAAQDYPAVTTPASFPAIHVEHRGYDNSRIAEKWAREHFVSPDQIFVTGSSAGAYGAWFNAPLHEMVWPAAQFQVLADAGNGVITQDFLQNDFAPLGLREEHPVDHSGRPRVDHQRHRHRGVHQGGDQLLPPDALGAVLHRVRRRHRRADRLLLDHVERQQPARRPHLVDGQLLSSTA